MEYAAITQAKFARRITMPEEDPLPRKRCLMWGFRRILKNKESA
jgi:hypothetical protein